MSNRSSTLKFGLIVLGIIFLGLLIFQMIALPVFFQSAVLKITSPFVAVSEKGARGAKGIFIFFVNIKEIAKENQDLRRDNLEMLQKLSDFKRREKDWEFSEKIVSAFKEGNYHFILARVIGRNPYYLNNNFLLDRGTENGVKAGMTVVTGGKFVVGRVKNAEKSWSEVMMLTNPSSSASVVFQDSGLIGVARGDRGIGLIIDLISLEKEVIAGETILTSGLDASFPPGLLVGTVDGIETQENGAVRARVGLPVDYAAIDRVAVLAEE